MYSSTSGDAPAAAAALNSRETTFSMPPDHSTTVWERQALSREKFDRDRYTSTKRDWSAESRSSSYRSSGVLGSGSLTASFNKRRAIGRHEAVENGRYRSTVGRSESSTSLRSPTQIGKAERDVCSPGYGSSPSMERPSKSLDGHHYRDARLSPGSVRPLSSPRIDSRLHGNHNDAEVSGAWDRERSRFSSPPYGWDASNRGRDHRERTWSRPDYRRPCPLPKLDSSKEWSQSDRELLEGRIDRYSSISGREVGFSDVSANGRDSNRNEWKGRERALQGGIPTYSPASNLYNRDARNLCLATDALGGVSPPQHSPLQSSFSHDSDLDLGPASSKKRPRLTWGQGLAKYEKEKTGEDLSTAKKSEEGSNYVGGLHSDGSVASALPELAFQVSNTLFCLEDGRPNQDQMKSTDLCLDGKYQVEQNQSVSHDSLANSSVKASYTSTLEESKYSMSELAVSGASDSGGLVLQYMQAFISRYQQELPNLSKDILTQHVEKVEFEIDRLEKELTKLDYEVDVLFSLPEKNTLATDMSLDMKPPEGEVAGEPLEPPAALCEDSPPHLDCTSVAMGSLTGASYKEVHMYAAGHAEEPMHEADVKEQNVHQVGEQCITGRDIPATENDLPASTLGKVNRQTLSAQSDEVELEENVKDPTACILLSNQEIAKQSLSALAHLSSPGIRDNLHVEGLSCNEQDTVWWKQDVERKKKLLESKISEEQKLRSFVEGVMAVRYRAKREAWKQGQVSNFCSKDKLVGSCDLEQKGNATPGRQSPLRLFPIAGSIVADAKNEEVQVAKKLLMEHPVERAREYVKMPPMVMGHRERVLHRFETKNGLVEDPVAAEQERKAMNPWSAEEKRIFLDKYSLLGKNLRKIASYLEHKTVADCVQFFYRNQKTEEFEKIHRRHQLKKRREARSSALYLATTTSVTNSHQANAAYVEGLSLVAAAAAAMSVPRSVRAMKSGPSGSTSSRACRDSYLVKQASSTSVLTAKDSNLEQSGVKTSQGIHCRGFKRPSDEVLQWRSQWNDNERELFMNAVAMYGKDFDCISAYIGSKSVGQCKAYFSKARRRLGLDQLIERQKEFPLNPRQQDDRVTNNTRRGSPTEVDVDLQLGGDVSEQPLKQERSPLRANSCLASEVHGDSPHENKKIEPVSGSSSPKSSQAAYHVSSGSLCQNAGQPVVDTLVNQGEHLTFLNTNGNVESSCNSAKARSSPLNSVHCCVNDSPVCGVASQIKVEPRSLKPETIIAPSRVMVVSHANSSQGIPAPASVSALIPPVGQSPPVKDKSVKTTEGKARREPTSWTQEEKEKFLDILKVHGKNWDLLCKSLPAKSLIQIKTYFQNSKAKLGLGSESAVTNSGRVGSSWKRKVDDSDSSSNAGQGLQNVSQKAHVLSEEGNLKANSNLLAASGVPGSNVLSAEALAYANIFGRKLLEDSINAQKVFHAMGLAPNASTPGILPMLSSAVFPQPSLVSAQQSYIQTASAAMKIPQVLNQQQPEQSLSSLMAVESSSSGGAHQAHQLQQQQQVAVTCPDLSLPGVQAGCNKQSLQLDQMSLLQQAAPPSQQQFQQMAEAVIQQLLPQAVQRHPQQLQLAGQQIPHHFQQVLSHHQVQSNWSVQSQTGSGSVPASIVPSQQMQQQTGLMQSHLPQAHSKLHTLIQQHQQLPQLSQLQLLQLQRQQQQQQQQQLLLHLQHAQALSQSQQIQNHTLLVQQNHSFSSEQQQPALLRGFAPVSNPGGEGIKQNDVDFQALVKSQQGTFGNVHQLHVSNQINEAPIAFQAVSEAQIPAGDVKLFGQSLLSQPVPGNQHPTTKFPSSSSPVVPPSITTGTRAGNTASNAFRDHVIPGQVWQQSMIASAHSNGNLRCNVRGDTEMGSVQEPVSCSNERVNVDGADHDDDRADDGKVVSAMHLPDGNLLSSATSSLDRGVISSATGFSSSGASFNHNDSQNSGQVVNLDHKITPSMTRKQDLGLVSGSTGGEVTVSQGLPRVLDALVALAEWRLQNSSGCSGKLTDEFLSQSWEALQKNPGSLIEAGRAGVSLSQFCSEGPQMLQHLRERLLSSHSSFMHPHSGAAGIAGSCLENAGLSNNGQNVPSQASITCIKDSDPALSDELVMMETDGSGGAIG